jgi:predicted alpha/beta hydrolase family esterase
VTTTESPTVVMVPGLRDHVADHWQTLLAEQLDRVRTVPPLERDKLSLEVRVAALDEVVNDVDGPVVLVAHSAGVLTTVHWAQRPSRTVRAALLATPPDFEVPLPEGYPSAEELCGHGWAPVPRRRLPFPTTVAASRNDPLASYRRVAGMAETWGSRLVDLGEVGHLNPGSGFGHWPMGEALVADLIERSDNARKGELAC